MATERLFVCKKCGSSERAGGLFNALDDQTKSGPAPCPKCGSECYLKVTFPFGLGAGKFVGRVLAVFSPKSRPVWRDANRGKIEFYPFLVICESLDAGKQRNVWLPYWHVSRSRGHAKAKYGQ